jgi:hypothetical protein
VLDSTGICWTKNQRHFDRGSGEADRGQYGRAEYVFGVTGAAAFYRRACLEDVAFHGEAWDEDFFLYREDADLAWRAAWRGWNACTSRRCAGRPAGFPTSPGRRPDDNRHSVRSRFLLDQNMPLATWLLLSRSPRGTWR